jgi:hypothetical protein
MRRKRMGGVDEVEFEFMALQMGWLIAAYDAGA